MARKEIYRSAITGRLVTEEFALANPDTTVKEKVSNLKELLAEFFAYCLEAPSGKNVDEIIENFLENGKKDS